MDQPQSADLTLGSLQAKGSETEPTGQQGVDAGEFVWRGKPVGAVVAATKVLRTLHDSERPLNASEVARAAGLHRGTAYNILRTLQAAGFVGYDEATHSYSLSLHILELAYGVLRRSGLMDLARPLMHAISDAHNVSVYVSKVLGPSSLLLLDWVGVAFRTDLYVTVGRPSPVPAGASGVIMAALGGAAVSLNSKHCSQKSRGTRSRLSPSSWPASKRRRDAVSRSIAARCFRELRWSRCRFSRSQGSFC
jgi:DNA-binding IclR family transcriptional regulator